MTSVQRQALKRAASRRTFLSVAAAGAAGAAAIAGSAAAAANSEKPADPDAALVIFGDELASVDRELGKVEERFAQIHDQVRSECPVPSVMQGLADEADDMARRDGRTMVPARFLIARAQSALRKSPDALDPKLPLAAKTEAVDVFKADVDAAYARLGYKQLEALHGSLASMESELVDKIYDTPAQGLTGVVVKLRVIDRMEMWTDAKPEDDFHRAFLGDTLRNAEQLAGLKPRSKS
ncbi:MAG TPA: hypothetical protein VKZ79_19910 [Alphaproteobacteria bacterium]|nr:hypothetical protein [Alphaproteobacteria bacterium]